MDTKCAKCGKDIKVKPSQIKPSGNYCSKNCYYESTKGKPGKKTGVIKSCAVCGTDFYVANARKDRAKCCSMKCKGILSRSIEKKCVVCGKGFIPTGGPDQPTCSIACGSEFRKSGVTVKCHTCGSDVYRAKSVAKDKNFCSKQCHDDYQGRDRDSYTCKVCGKHFTWSPSRIKHLIPKYCSIQCRTSDEEWRLNAAVAGNMAQMGNKGPNQLEIEGRILLTSMECEFIEQYLYNGKFVVDVFIPEYNIVIQWDGDYWHGYKSRNGEYDSRQLKRMALDKSQDAYMEKCGTRVLRFWEHDVYDNSEVVRENIEAAIRQATG